MIDGGGQVILCDQHQPWIQFSGQTRLNVNKLLKRKRATMFKIVAIKLKSPPAHGFPRGNFSFVKTDDTDALDEKEGRRRRRKMST